MPSKALLAASGRVREMQNTAHLASLGIQLGSVNFERQPIADHAKNLATTIKGNLQRMVRKKLADKNPLFIDFEEDDDGSGTAEAIEEVNWRDPFSWIDRLSLAELGVTDAQINEGVVAFDEAVGEPDGSAVEAVPEASGEARRQQR